MRPGISTLASAMVLGSLLGGCTTGRTEVHQYGLMHDVLSGGAANAVSQVSLQEVLKRPGAVGVGALAGLEGEITILDGQAWVARPAGGALRVDGPAGDSAEGAALLAVAYVEDWTDVPIDLAMRGDELEQFISKAARENGLDPATPFPFVVVGECTDLQVHVINGECPMRPGADLTAAQQPWRYEADQPTAAKVVGIYAGDSVGKLTHPGTSIHAHVLMDAHGNQVTGHVERVAVAGGSVLRLPRTLSH